MCLVGTGGKLKHQYYQSQKKVTVDVFYKGLRFVCFFLLLLDEVCFLDDVVNVM